MRAKMKIESVNRRKSTEDLTMTAVCRNDGYPEDGSDEDNTFAKFTPTATLSMCITNPDLFGTFNPGEKYYLDFTKAEE